MSDIDWSGFDEDDDFTTDDDDFAIAEVSAQPTVRNDQTDMLSVFDSVQIKTETTAQDSITESEAPEKIPLLQSVSVHEVDTDELTLAEEYHREMESFLRKRLSFEESIEQWYVLHPCTEEVPGEPGGKGQDPRGLWLFFNYGLDVPIDVVPEVMLETAKTVYDKYGQYVGIHNDEAVADVPEEPAVDVPEEVQPLISLDNPVTEEEALDNGMIGGDSAVEVAVVEPQPASVTEEKLQPTSVPEEKPTATAQATTMNVFNIEEPSQSADDYGPWTEFVNETLPTIGWKFMDDSGTPLIRCMLARVGLLIYQPPEGILIPLRKLEKLMYKTTDIMKYIRAVVFLYMHGIYHGDEFDGSRLEFPDVDYCDGPLIMILSYLGFRVTSVVGNEPLYGYASIREQGKPGCKALMSMSTLATRPVRQRVDLKLNNGLLVYTDGTVTNVSFDYRTGSFDFWCNNMLLFAKRDYMAAEGWMLDTIVDNEIDQDIFLVRMYDDDKEFIKANPNMLGYMDNMLSTFKTAGIYGGEDKDINWYMSQLNESLHFDVL